MSTTADADVPNGTYVNTNYGSATELQSITVAAAKDGYIRESYLKFDCALGITVRR